MAANIASQPVDCLNGDMAGSGIARLVVLPARSVALIAFKHGREGHMEMCRHSSKERPPERESHLCSPIDPE